MLFATEKEREVRLVNKKPFISLTLPFEPKLDCLEAIKDSLEKAVYKVQSELRKYYLAPDVFAETKRLQSVIKNLNYTTHRKSIAIFISDNFEKVFYLDIPVNESISIDGAFHLKDLIQSKKQKKEYIVLALENKQIKIFLGNESGLIKLILTNGLEKNENCSNTNAIERKKYYHLFDNSLSHIINAYQLPVFITGTSSCINEFVAITQNGHSIIEYIPVETIEINSTMIKKIMWPHIMNWNKVKDILILRNMRRAAQQNKLVAGMHEVWITAVKRNVNKLIIDDDIYTDIKQFQLPINLLNNNSENKFPFYINDLVDDVIEKALKDNCEIEFCSKGMLANHGHIALIKNY